MNYKEVQTIVKKYDKKLLATDPRFGYTVSLAHEEGTTFTLNMRSLFFLKTGT